MPQAIVGIRYAYRSTAWLCKRFCVLYPNGMFVLNSVDDGVSEIIINPNFLYCMGGCFLYCEVEGPTIQADICRPNNLPLSPPPHHFHMRR